MTTSANILRWTGAVLVTAFLLFVLGHGITLFTHGRGPFTVLFVLLFGLVMVFSSGLVYKTWNTTNNGLLHLTAATAFGVLGLLAVLVCALLLGEFRATAEIGETENFKTIIRPIILVMDTIRALVFIFLGLGIVPLGILIVKQKVISSWLGWVGVFDGILLFLILMLALFGVLNFGSIFTITRYLAIFVAFLFLLVLGIKLILSSQK